MPLAALRSPALPSKTRVAAKRCQIDTGFVTITPMTEITRNTLRAYIDDALTDAETARVEHALRDSDTLRDDLRLVMQERDRGDHSVGAVWRRARLTCPAREQLGSYLLEALDPELR